MRVKFYIGEITGVDYGKKLIIDFLGPAGVDDELNFIYYPFFPALTPFNRTSVFRPVRVFSGEVTIGANALEQAVNYFNAFQTDYNPGGSVFNVTREGTRITIEATNGSPLDNPTLSPGSQQFATFLSGNTRQNNFSPLDLFGDETISFTSKLSDIEKLSNVFLDFSNSFSVPATPPNNELFKHYYDVDIDGTFNANVRVLSYLEIDTFPLRWGKLQLESVSMKDGRPDSYKVTFYGGLVQLSDLFGEDTIDRLDYTNNIKERSDLSQYDFNYTESEILRSINDPSFKSGNIMTPLISYTNRDWNIGTADTNDITTDDGAIKDNELKQAIRIEEILKAIENKYSINFTRDFFGKSVFKNLFMWLNGKNSYQSYIDFDSAFVPIGIPPVEQGYIPSVNTSTDVISIQMYDVPSRDDKFIVNLYWPFDINGNLKAIYDDNFNVSIIIEDQRPGREGEILYNSIRAWQNSDLHVEQVIFSASSLEMNFDEPLLFKIKTDFNTPVIWDQFRLTTTFPLLPSGVLNYQYKTETLSSTGVKVSTVMPRIKVIDFLHGIMKMFKLVVRPITSDTFYVNTLDGFYSDGKILNVNEYVDNSQLLVERPLIYKEILFQYEKTNNVAGKKFRELYDPYNDEIGYGDLKFEYKTIENKETLEIRLPFENMLFERMRVSSDGFPTTSDGRLTNVLIGQSISPNENYTQFSPNQSKPILFFNNGVESLTDVIRYKFLNNTEVNIESSYIIGNSDNYILNQVSNTINWGEEIDPWHDRALSNSLYLNYWSNWIETIYSLKQRKFTIDKVILPPRFIEELSLNDRLVIGSQRYKINDYTVNLTNGEVKFTLFKDVYDFLEGNPDGEFTGRQFTPSLGGLYITDFVGSGNYWLYGSFTTYGGAIANRVIKLRPDGSQDLTFNTSLGGPNQPPFANMTMKETEDGLIVGGFFTTYNGVSRNRITKLKPNGTLDSSFSIGTGFNNYVTKIEGTTGGDIFVGGQFTSYNSNTSNRLAKLGPTGAFDNSFNIGSGFNNAVTDLALNSDGSLYVSGYFTQLQGSTRNFIAKVGPTGAIDSSFNPGATSFLPLISGQGAGVISILSASDGGVYAAGHSFTSYQGVSANRIVKLLPNGFIDSSFNYGTGFNDIVVNINYTSTGNIFCSGNFINYNGKTSRGGIIIAQNGDVVQTFPQTGYYNHYIIDDQVYAISNTGTPTLTRLTRRNELILDRQMIQFNAGSKWFSFNVYSDTDWVITKTDDGFGTDWIEISTPEGNGNSEIPIFCQEKVTQSPPDLYNTRTMYLKISAGQTEKWIRIYQTGLLP